MQADINWHMVTGTLGTLSPDAGSRLTYGGTGVLAAMTATIQARKTALYQNFGSDADNSGLTLD